MFECDNQISIRGDHTLMGPHSLQDCLIHYRLITQTSYSALQTLSMHITKMVTSVCACLNRGNSQSSSSVSLSFVHT